MHWSEYKTPDGRQRFIDEDEYNDVFKRERTNPDTCLHRVIKLAPELFSYLVICVSCDSTIDHEWAREFNWEHDLNTDSWIQRGRVERSQTPADSGD